MKSERCFVVVIEWPAGADRLKRAEFIAAATGKPATICLGLAGKPLPSVIHTALRDEARAATTILRGSGVLAVYPSNADLDAVGDPFVCKRLAPAIGAPEPMYLCEPRMGRLEPRPLKMGDVTLLVKGRVDQSVVKTEADASGVNPGTFMAPRPFGPFGPFGPHPRDLLDDDFGSGLGGGTVTTRKGSSYGVIDLYTAGAPAIRVDGRRFDFELLGKRSLTETDNLNRLAIMLAEQAPGAHIDLDFQPSQTFPHINTSRTHAETGGTVVDKAPAFDFYSRLQCLIDRALRKAGRR